MNIYVDTWPRVVRFQERPVEFPVGLTLVATGTAMVDGALRRYYAAHPPLRLLLVMKTGAEATDLRIGRYVDALVGWDEGDNPYVLPGQERKQHTKITVLRIFDDPPQDAAATPLSEIVAKAPRADRPGGWRGGNGGRPRLVNDDPIENHTVSLPSKLWRLLELEGSGNRSAGVRRAAVLADLWEERQ